MSDKMYYIMDYNTKSGPFSEASIKERFENGKEFSVNARVIDEIDGVEISIKAFLGYEEVGAMSITTIPDKTLEDYKGAVSRGIGPIILGCSVITGLFLSATFWFRLSSLGVMFMIPLYLASMTSILIGAFQWGTHENEARRFMHHEQMMKELARINSSKD